MDPQLAANPVPGETSPTPLPRVLGDRLGYLLAKCHQVCHERAAEALAEQGLTVKHFGCLAVIADEGPLSQHALGERMRVDRTTMVNVVDELEQRGYVKRRRNPIDRRAYALEATAGGRRWLATAGERLAGAEEGLLAGLPASERDDLRTLLRKLLLTSEGLGAS